MVLLTTLLLTSAGLASASDDAAKAAYENGDFATALREYEARAEQGEAEAQFGLGVLYQRGEGVERSRETAAAWYRKAAAQGHVAAQFNLAYLYEVGLGVPQDDGQSVRWYRAAADQGHARSHFKLGFMYFNGRGTGSPDLVQAYKHIKISVDLGFAGGERSLTMIASRITEDERARADELAAEWLSARPDQG
jgi:TPR repeat protein